MEWASGNAGYAMTGVAKTADDYPTFQIANGKNGKCLSLVTCNCSFWRIGRNAYCPDSLFIGSFDVNNAMSNPASNEVRPSFRRADLSGRLL